MFGIERRLLTPPERDDRPCPERHGSPPARIAGIVEHHDGTLRLAVAVVLILALARVDERSLHAFRWCNGRHHQVGAHRVEPHHLLAHLKLATFGVELPDRHVERVDLSHTELFEPRLDVLGRSVALGRTRQAVRVTRELFQVIEEHPAPVG